jgi:hypothetical protein
MFIDLLERLFDVMGDRKYHDFALWLYKERGRNELFDHGVPTYENIRVPL